MSINRTALRYRHFINRHYTSKATLDEIIRVDHAGELGADRIYAGQMAVLGSTSKGPLIQHMWDQEKGHRAKFEELIRKHRVRPTFMTPIWNVAGFVLGAGTALLGEKAAMACTVAVETVIVEHYNDQLRTLLEDPNSNKELMDVITKFRDEEQEHHDTGIDHGAEQAPYYELLSDAIKSGCKVAIAISKEVLCGSLGDDTFQLCYYGERLYQRQCRSSSAPSAQHPVIVEIVKNIFFPDSGFENDSDALLCTSVEEEQD